MRLLPMMLAALPAVMAQWSPWFEDTFTSTSSSTPKWSGLDASQADIWNNMMLQSGDEVKAWTKGKLKAVSSTTPGDGMNGKVTIEAQWNAHPDHLTDDDAMIMICTGATASAAWWGQPGCVKFLLWDEGAHYWKRVLTDSYQDQYPTGAQMRQTMCSIVDKVTVVIEVTTTQVTFFNKDAAMNCPNITVANTVAANNDWYLYLASDNDMGDWFSWNYVKVTNFLGETRLIDEFTSSTTSNNMWNRQVDPMIPASLGVQYTSKFLDTGMLRMTGSHKVQMKPNLAFGNTAGGALDIDKLWFNLESTVTRNIRIGPDGTHDDDFALFICEKNAWAATSDTWSWWSSWGCVKFFLWDLPSEQSYFLHKEICARHSCSFSEDPVNGYVQCGDGSMFENYILKVESRPVLSYNSPSHVRFNFTWRVMSKPIANEPPVEFCPPQWKLVNLDARHGLVAGIGVDEDHGRYTVIDDFKLTQQPHPPLSPPPPLPPPPPSPSPLPPPSPPSPPPSPRPPPSPPPSGSLLLEDYFSNRQQSAVNWPQIEAGSDTGGVTDYFDVIEGALAFTGDNTHMRYTKSAMPALTAAGSMYMIKVTYRTSMSGQDMEVDNDAKVILCPQGRPYNGYIWSATPWTGEADECVRIGLVDDDSGRINAQIDLPDGKYVDSTRCDVNVTSVHYTVHVNTTAVKIVNDAGCSTIELGTLIGQKKAELYIATDDDYGYWTIFDRVEIDASASGSPATSFSETFQDRPEEIRNRWWWPEASRGQIATLPGLMRVRRNKGFETRMQLLPKTNNGAVPTEFDFSMSVLPLLGWRGLPDRYSFVICEAASVSTITNFWSTQATNGDLAKCASAPFDPDAYKIDVDNTIIPSSNTRDDESCANVPQLSSLLISVDATYIYKQTERCADTFGFKKFRSPATMVAHGLTPPFVAGIEISIGEYAGDGGFGGNVNHVTFWKRDPGFIWNDAPAQAGGGKRPTGPNGRLVEDPPGASCSICNGGSYGPSGLAVLSFLINLGLLMWLTGYCMARRGMLPGTLGEKYNFANVPGRARGGGGMRAMTDPMLTSTVVATPPLSLAPIPSMNTAPLSTEASHSTM